ncbi:MAG: V-type ATP synthase subunit E family protein [Spirochaetia bacterium]
MEQEKDEEDMLLRGIAEEGQREADKILSEAEQQAKEIIDGAKKRAEKIVADAEERAAGEAETIQSRNRRTIETEQRKIRLKAEENLFAEALEMVRSRLKELQRAHNYPDILQGWIAEAALGLDVEKAEVNGSAEERKHLTEALLRKAEEEVNSRGGGVKLSVSQKEPLSEQGVVLEEMGGRLFFNNRVEARLKRYAPEVRRMIYEEIKKKPE